AWSCSSLKSFPRHDNGCDHYRREILIKGPLAVAFRFVLSLPRIVLHPLTSVCLGAVHVYLAVGHLGELTAGNVQWTHVWKGFGALAGAYIFAALASRGLARGDDRRLHTNALRQSPTGRLDPKQQKERLEARVPDRPRSTTGATEKSGAPRHKH